MKKRHDSILSVVHETAKGMRNAGIMDEMTMRESGGKKPGPTAVKLLNLIDRKGIEVVI